MIHTDEDALICDLAETYHIFNYRELPPSLAATLSVGLKDDSRIKKKLRNVQSLPEYLVDAFIMDALNILIWQNTKDGSEGKNKPELIMNRVLGEEKDSNYLSFASGEDFEKYRKELLNGN
ncbi:MAG: hypothetical protein IJF87_08730 [Erysipelotrichaceae bacterium]|nr:hypothetical protein [Erysipelotrichaceae bacterium]